MFDKTPKAFWGERPRRSIRKYKPWELVGYHAFADERRAREFEHYLKSGSGKAFANRRLW